MNPKVWIAVLMLGAFAVAPASGEIYKTVDAEGNVEFSDVPPPPSESGEPVNVQPLNTFQPEAAPDAEKPAEPATPDVPEVPSYDALSILSPADDETVRENAGNVTVAVTLTPPLRAGDQLVLYMDGNRLPDTAQGQSFYLQNVDRGAHTMGVRVVNAQGDVVAESPPSTFYLQRVSVNSPPRPSPAG